MARGQNRKVWMVVGDYSDYDAQYTTLDSIWTIKKNAQSRCDELQAKEDRRHGVVTYYELRAFKLNTEEGEVD